MKLVGMAMNVSNNVVFRVQLSPCGSAGLRIHAARNSLKQDGNRRISKMDITDLQVLQRVRQIS